MEINTLNLYDTEAAAEYCDLSISGFKHHAQAGNITPVYARRKVTLYTRESLDQLKARPSDGRGAPRKLYHQYRSRKP